MRSFFLRGMFPLFFFVLTSANATPIDPEVFRRVDCGKTAEDRAHWAELANQEPLLDSFMNSTQQLAKLPLKDGHTETFRDSDGLVKSRVTGQLEVPTCHLYFPQLEGRALFGTRVIIVDVPGPGNQEHGMRVEYDLSSDGTTEKRRILGVVICRDKEKCAEYGIPNQPTFPRLRTVPKLGDKVEK